MAVGPFVLGWAALISGGGVASAQEPAFTMSFDTLLVAPVQPLADGLDADADRITADLSARMADRVDTLDIRDVPAFEAQGYDAATYVRGCPLGEYTGCALVVGQRIEADWAVGGTLSRVEGDLLSDGPPPLLFEVHFVDVAASREVVSVGVVLSGEGDDVVLGQLVDLFDRIIEGAYDDEDVRGEIEDPEVRARMERAQEELVARSLDELEATVGALQRAEPIRDVQPPRLSREELQREYADRDDSAPWERLGMTDRQYVRFRNSGLPLEEWRRRLRGRFGQVLLRGGFTTGAGPWGVQHEGQYLLGFDEASSTFQTLEVVQYQELVRAPSLGFEGELGFGVAPFLEVGFAVTSRASRVSFRFDQETEGEPPFLPDPSGTTTQTLQLGPRITFVPLPALPVRPLLGVGISWWQGRGVPPSTEPFQRLEAPSLTLLQVAPGVEASAGQHVNLWLRGMIDQPVAGRTLDERREGEALLPNPPAPTQDYGMGFGVQAGFQVRLTVLPDRHEVGPQRFDDEPDDL